MELKDVYEELERLRKKEKLSEMALTEGIMSVRSYRRYHYLEHDMPFDKLEALCQRVHTSLYDLLYYVEHNIIESNMDEALLLNLLIQDQYEEANKKIKHMDVQSFKTSSHQFLLPLFLLKLDVYNKVLSLDKANQEMFKGLNLDALKHANWMTVDHYILMEHLLPWMSKENKVKTQQILKDVINGKKTLIRVSNYTLIKIYMFDVLLSLELGKDKKEVISDIHKLIKAMYEFGSELVIDEVLTFLIAYQLDEDDSIRTLLNQYLIPLSYIYHLQSVHDDDESIRYIKKHHQNMTFNLTSFKATLS